MGCEQHYGNAKHCNSVVNVTAFHSQLSWQTHEDEVEKAHPWGCGRIQKIKCSTRSLMVAKLTVWHKPWEHVRSLWSWSCRLHPHFSFTFPASSHSSAGRQCSYRLMDKILFSAKDISISWPFRGHWILCCFPPFALWYFSFISTVRLQLGDEFSSVSVPRRLSFLLSHGASPTLLYQPFIMFYIASIMLPSLYLLNANAMHL